jgi:hypothetical protein
MVAEITHVAYSDETHHNVGRFKGIGVVTAPIDHATQASEEVKAILATANVSELKWEKLRTARDRIAAVRVADWLFSKIAVLRFDVLVGHRRPKASTPTSRRCCQPAPHVPPPDEQRSQKVSDWLHLEALSR